MRRLICTMSALALALVGLSTAAPAHAASNRIQVEILRIKVLDDADDQTRGELTYRFRLQRGSASCAEHWCNGPGNAFIERYSTSATTGAVIGVNRTLGGEHGLALSPGDEMRLSFAGVEEDWDLADPTAGFCPIASAYSFNDSMCGAHDRLGVAHVVGARLEPTSDWNSPELDATNNEARRSFTWSAPPQPAQPAGPIYFQTVPGSSPAGGGAIGSPARQKPASTVAGTTPRR
jgi:hypothetical protein